MQPVLIVEGRELEVYAAYYRGGKIESVSVLSGDDLNQQYYDVSEDVSYHATKPLQIDFATCLIWKNKNDDEINKIKKRIESYEERMVELSFEHIKCSEPFAEKLSLKNEFFELENKAEALYEALMIIEGNSETDAK